MEKVDILIQTLSPEIDLKCAEIRQKKSERLLTKIFIAAAVLMLTFPVLLIWGGISLFIIFIPIVFVGTVFFTVLPVLMSKGGKCYE